MSKSVNVLEVQDLYKTFRIGFLRKKVEAVRGVSFAVKEGEIFGLLGPNGAGKTTTLKVMMGLISADKGKFRILAEDGLRSNSRRKVGFLPENAYFHEYLNCYELLRFYGKLFGLSKANIRERSEKLIEQVGLTDAAKRPLRKFSKGMLQRIGLAQALIAEPKLLILDEPMSGLDPMGRKFVADLVAERNATGVSVLFSSHILSDVERLCDRVVILNKGIKVEEGTIDELVGKDSEDQTLEDLFMRRAKESSKENAKETTSG